jgi:hypothetical protein
VTLVPLLPTAPPRKLVDDPSLIDISEAGGPAGPELQAMAERLIAAASGIDIRGTLALVNPRIVSIYKNAIIRSADLAYRPIRVVFEFTIPDRLTGAPKAINLHSTFESYLTAACVEPDQAMRSWFLAKLRDFFEHETEESMWDGRPETDPHRRPVRALAEEMTRRVEEHVAGEMERMLVGDADA